MKIESRLLYKAPDRPVYFQTNASVVEKATP